MAEYLYTNHPTKRKANGKKQSISVHRKVWIEHHGEIPNGFIVHHKDGDKQNNEIINLELISRKEHRLKHPLKNQKKIMKFVRSKKFL